MELGEKCQDDKKVVMANSEGDANAEGHGDQHEQGVRQQTAKSKRDLFNVRKMHNAFSSSYCLVLAVTGS